MNDAGLTSADFAACQPPRHESQARASSQASVWVLEHNWIALVSSCQSLATSPPMKSRKAWSTLFALVLVVGACGDDDDGSNDTADDTTPKADAAAGEADAAPEGPDAGPD